jgi:cell division septal protein FtsQ
MLVRKFRSPELTEKRRKRLVRFFVFYIGAGLILAVSLVLLLRIDWFKIKSVEVVGNSVESSKHISDVTKERLSGNYLYFIPKSNFLFYPRRALKGELLNSFKRFEEVGVSYEGDNTLLVDVEERKPLWLWCEDQDCYFMDKDGYVFAKAPNFSGNVYLRASGGLEVQSGEVIGSVFAGNWNFEELKAFVEAIKENGFVPVGIVITPERDAELLLKNGEVIKLSPTKSLTAAHTDLENALASGLISSEVPLQYIDLRFDNKIFYKAKE